jgi:hypothetical protein
MPTELERSRDTARAIRSALHALRQEASGLGGYRLDLHDGFSDCGDYSALSPLIRLNVFNVTLPR